MHDRQAIRDVLARYCERLDDHDIDGVAELFTDDCAFDPGPGMGGPRRGKEAIFPAQRERMQRFRSTQHQLGQSLIDFVADGRARASTYCTAWHERWSGEIVIGRLRYLDDFVRIDDDWRIATRTLIELGVDGMPHGTWNASPRRMALGVRPGRG